jgi:hypothetical protein
MSKMSVRLPLVIALFVVLLLAVIVSNVPIADSNSQGSDSSADEQVASTEMGAASSTVSYAGQQSAAGADHIFTLASQRFEPLLLLLLGSTLLFIGSGIKLLLSRRLRRIPDC